MLENYSRLEAINSQISELKEKILELETEKSNLLANIACEETTVLSQLPARARNAFLKFGLNSDFKMKYFLDGDSRFIIKNRVGFNKERYKLASTNLDRLLSLPNIGKGTALKVVQLLEEHEKNTK